MMKKLFALALSMMMAVSLAVPAFAALKAGGAAPVSAQDGDFDWWTAEKEYLDSHPGLEERLRANAYDYFAQNYPDYESAQEYMEFWGMTEEEFLDEMMFLQVSDLIWQEQRQKEIDETKIALGGVPGQVGVIIDGQYIQFPDAVPEVTKGRTMVPIRALVETLGGDIDYQAGAVQFILDGYVYEFAIGSPVVKVRPEDGGMALPNIVMDCEPYLKDNRTYVPVRFISEALGYEVGWDGDYRTAVLVDKDALAEEIDQSFTILNRVQASRGLALEQGENSLIDAVGTLTATVFDTLNGNQVYTAELSGQTLMNAEALNGSYSLTISDNALEALAGLMLAAGADPEQAALFGAVLSGLDELEVIVNREGMVWAHAPVLDELSGQESVWAGMEFGPELGTLLALQMDAGSLTMGSVIVGFVDVGSVTSYAEVREMAGLLATAYGDDRFVTDEDGVSTLTFGLDDLAGLELDGAQEALDAFTEYQITMVVDEQGGATVSCVMETAAQLGTPSVRIVVDAAQSAGQADLTMTVHVANVCEIELTAAFTESASTDSPRTEPPADAVIEMVQDGFSSEEP